MYLSLTFLKVNNSFHLFKLEMIRTREKIVKGPGVILSQKKSTSTLVTLPAFCTSVMIGPLC